MEGGLELLEKVHNTRNTQRIQSCSNAAEYGPRLDGSLVEHVRRDIIGQPDNQAFFDHHAKPDSEQFHMFSSPNLVGESPIALFVEVDLRWARRTQTQNFCLMVSSIKGIKLLIRKWHQF